MISYGKQSIDQSDIDAVINVLKSDWLTQGPVVEIFENRLGKYFNAKHVCAVSNGTAALHLCAIALGWKKGDIVITSPMSFVASANCISYVGATPDFVDIDNETYNIDIHKLEEKISSYRSIGKKIKAVIGVDFAGNPCDWKTLRSLANKYEFDLINDNCHAIGASYKNDIGYAVKYADLVTQSYHPVKNITTGEGGAILSNNPDLIKCVRKLRSHGIVKKRNNQQSKPWFYEMNDLGYNYRITDFQCALGLSQINKLENFIRKRNEIARIYDNSLSGLEHLKTTNTHKDIRHAYHLYPLLIEYNALNITKEYFFEKLREENINLQVHYIPIHLQPYYKNNFNFKEGDFPCAENFYQQEVSLPIFPDLDSKRQEFIISLILDILK